MKKLFRTSIEQTGAAIFVNDKGEEKIIPLFSDNPCEEARGIRLTNFYNYTLRDVFYSNNLMDFRIEDMVKDYIKRYGCLPENYMDELASGFPFIFGRNTNYTYCYK